MFQEFAKTAPEIIKAAATSPLGFAAFCILALVILGFYFFRNETTRVKVGMFILLFLGIGFLFFSLMSANKSVQNKSEEKTDGQKTPSPTQTPPSSPTPESPQTNNQLNIGSSDITLVSPGTSKTYEFSCTQNNSVAFVFAKTGESNAWFNTEISNESGQNMYKFVNDNRNKGFIIFTPPVSGIYRIKLSGTDGSAKYKITMQKADDVVN